MKSFVKNVFGKLYTDRAYTFQKLTDILFVDGIYLVYKLRNNMKGELPLKDRIMLMKMAVIEFVNDELMNICQIEHTRHRSFANFLTNLIGGLIAYSFLPKKPSIRVDSIEDSQLTIF